MSFIIGQYRVTGTIGQGGMGAVYAGEHVLLGRAAAIKILLPELSQRQDAVTRFFNEARAAAAIKHPGIVEIYDFGWSTDGAAFIVMERLEGEPLSRRLARGRLGWRAALPIVRQIAGALAAAHAKGVVHRDLKPDNIFLVPDAEVPGGERIKLLDFGIAKLAGESSLGLNVTRTGAVMGTPTYMSPEQCRGVAADHRADLYALGCIAFELCGGRPPFVGEGTGDVLAAHIHLPVPAVETLAHEIPPGVAQLIQRLLEKQPSDRCQTADELIRAIDAVAGGGSPPARAPQAADDAVTAASGAVPTTLTGAAQSSTRAPFGAGPRMRWWVVGATAAVAIGVAAAVVWSRSEQPSVAARPSEPIAAAPAPQPAPAAPAAAFPAPSPPPAPAAPPVASPAAAAPTAAPAAPTASPAPPAPDDVAVTIESTPAGAQVMLDGVALGKTPYLGSLPRKPGSSTVVLRLAGYGEKRVVVSTEHETAAKVKLARIARTPKDNPDESVNPFR